jgi:hypothetical protein
MLTLDLDIDRYKKQGFKILTVIYITAIIYFGGDIMLVALETHKGSESIMLLRVLYTALASLTALFALIVVAMIGYKVSKILSFQSKQSFTVEPETITIKSPLDYAETKIPLATVTEINLTLAGNSMVAIFQTSSKGSKKTTKRRAFLYSADKKRFTDYIAKNRPSIKVTVEVTTQKDKKSKLAKV